MSSTLGSEPAYYFPGQSHYQPSSSEDLGGSSTSNHKFGWREENSWQPLFRNGLPTPPISKAMTGAVLKNNYNNSVHPPTQNRLRYPQQDASNGGTSNGERKFVGVEQEQLGYHSHPQRHRGNTSRDFGFDTKKSSGNVIASNFRIPESVNSSGGSIAEFATEVCRWKCCLEEVLTFYADNLPVLVRVRSHAASC